MNVSGTQTKNGAARHFREGVSDVTTTTTITIINRTITVSTTTTITVINRTITVSHVIAIILINGTITRVPWKKKKKKQCDNCQWPMTPIQCNVCL